MSTTIKQAINEFLLSCKAEGKSYGTSDCYSDKRKGFLGYATNDYWHGLGSQLLQGNKRPLGQNQERDSTWHRDIANVLEVKCGEPPEPR